MARPRNTEQRQEQIVQGLLAVMADRGYERASVAQIAQAAGLTPGLVHYHFKTKQDILLRLVDFLGVSLDVRLERRIAKAETARGRLEAFIDVHLATGEGSNPKELACWVAAAAEAIRQPAVAEAFGRSIRRSADRLEELMRDALTEAGRSTRPARRYAAGLLATFEGYFLVATTVPDVVPRGTAAATAKKMVAGFLDSTPGTEGAEGND